VIEGQRRFTIRDRDGKAIIRGKIDGRLAFADGQKPIYEVKWGDSFRHISKLEDFESSRWSRHTPDQLLAYLLAESIPWGVIVVKKPGLPAIIPVRLEDHLDRAEGFLRDARMAVDTRYGLRNPPPFIDDTNECLSCPHFNRTCSPPGVSQASDGSFVIRDLEALRAVDEMMRVEQDGKRYAYLKDRLRSYARKVAEGSKDVRLLFGGTVCTVKTAEDGRVTVTWDQPGT
jgi:hypothetical protein